jgi:hypothetical protein
MREKQIPPLAAKRGPSILAPSFLARSVHTELNHRRQPFLAIAKEEGTKGLASPQAAGYPSNHFRNVCSVAARPMRAMDVVSGISFGQTLTQFWALPQT